MIPSEHLRACPDHRLVSEGDTDDPCPACETGVEARPEASEDINISQTDLRWQIEKETMLELLPLLQEEVAEAGGELFVTVAELSQSSMPYGYTRQERWINVIVISRPFEKRRVLKQESEAEDVLERLKAGEEYLPRIDEDELQITPKSVQGVVEPYCYEVEYEQVNPTRVRITLGTNSRDDYKAARKELGTACGALGLKVYTREVGGKYIDGVVDVSVRTGP